LDAIGPFPSTGWPRASTGRGRSRPRSSGRDRPLPVDGLAEGVDDAAGQRLADGHLRDALGARDGVAFLDEDVRAEQHGADVVLFEVEHEAVDVARELKQLAGHGALESVDAGDTVAHLDDAAGFLEVDLGLVALELPLDDLADLLRLDHAIPSPAARACARAARRDCRRE
jgi:hypothetical protein